MFRVLRPSSRNLNCVCFVRTISDIEKHLVSEHASNFCDVIRQDGGKPVRDDAKKKALKELKQKLKVYDMYVRDCAVHVHSTFVHHEYASA